jgi:hypothetical protein
MDYQQIILELSSMAAAVGTSVGILWRRVTKIEELIDRKLNNGIRDELNKIQVSMATLTADIKHLPRRKSDD